MKTTLEYMKPITAPIVKGDEYGKLVIEIEGRPKTVIPLLADKNVSKVNPFFKIIAATKYLLFGTSLDEK